MRSLSARFGSLGAYLFVSFAYFGASVVAHPNSRTIGTGSDPYGFVWAFAWWPHAILHGHNPFFTHTIWTPGGFDLAWTTSIPALAILFAPLTLVAGPLVSYNVVALVLPALAAWTAYLVCRRLTRSFWPSLTGGYLFGFSSYMLGHEQGHEHLTPVFTLPLGVLLVLRRLDGRLGSRRFTVELALLLAFVLGTSTEIMFTFSLAALGALPLGAACFPEQRPALRALVAPAFRAYVAAAVIASPFLYYALSGFQSGSVNRTSLFPGDVLNLAVPTELIAVGGERAQGIARHFLGFNSENVLYLGAPTILIVIWYLVGKRREPVSGFLAVVLLVTVVASFGSSIYVEGRRIGAGPWALVGGLPLFDNVITPRLAVYTALVASVTVALWGASPRISRPLRAVLLAAAIISLVPRAFSGSYWKVNASVPQFFAAGGAYRCLPANANLLVLPNVSDALLWQARDGFRFGLAMDDFQPVAPAGIADRTVATDIEAYVVPSGVELRAFAKANRIDEVVVTGSGAARWTAAARAALGRPRAVEGVQLYDVAAKQHSRKAPCT